MHEHVPAISARSTRTSSRRVSASADSRTLSVQLIECGPNAKQHSVRPAYDVSSSAQHTTRTAQPLSIRHVVRKARRAGKHAGVPAMGGGPTTDGCARQPSRIQPRRGSIARGASVWSIASSHACTDSRDEPAAQSRGRRGSGDGRNERESRRQLADAPLRTQSTPCEGSEYPYGF